MIIIIAYKYTTLKLVDKLGIYSIGTGHVRVRAACVQITQTTAPWKNVYIYTPSNGRTMLQAEV